MKIETSNGSRFAEHFCLEMTSLVPGRLEATGCCIVAVIGAFGIEERPGNIVTALAF